MFLRRSLLFDELNETLGQLYYCKEYVMLPLFGKRRVPRINIPFILQSKILWSLATQSYMNAIGFAVVRKVKKFLKHFHCPLRIVDRRDGVKKLQGPDVHNHCEQKSCLHFFSPKPQCNMSVAKRVACIL